MGSDKGHEGERRPSRDEYFMSLAFIVAMRSTCTRRSVGAVVVKDGRILTTGYNGPPAGMAHCRETGCLREDLNVPSGERHELCMGLHAEQNAIIQAGYQGLSIRGATMYVTNRPCSVCAKMIANAGIRAVVYAADYEDPLSDYILEECKIELRHLPFSAMERENRA